MPLAACEVAGISVERLTAAAIARGKDLLSMVIALLSAVKRVHKESIGRAMLIGKLHKLEPYVQFY
jgi:hypothetical protein